jgi:hypothetical protein
LEFGWQKSDLLPFNMTGMGIFVLNDDGHIFV